MINFYCLGLFNEAGKQNFDETFVFRFITKSLFLQNRCLDFFLVEIQFPGKRNRPAAQTFSVPSTRRWITSV